MQKLLIVLFHAFGHLQDKLRQVVTFLAEHVGIGLAHHVQHHVVVARVAVVAMHVPVSRMHVNLHVAHPQRSAQAHLGIEEVGPGIAVVQARVDDLHLAAVGGMQRSQRQQLVFPDIM